MRSVKPGRGPSFMSGVGSIAAAAFGVFWVIMASSMGAPPFFAMFGVIFVLMAVGGAIYSFYNATARKRMSIVDLASGDEEPDPISEAMGYSGQPEGEDRSAGERRVEGGHQREQVGRPAQDHAGEGERRTATRQFPGDYCPFCGAKVSPDYDYCPKCGRDI